MTRSHTAHVPSNDPRPAPGGPAASPARRPYVAPALHPLGAVPSLTAGSDAAGTLDGIVGGTGGFVQADDMDPAS